MSTVTSGMTGQEMVALSKQHSLFEWSAQGAVDPIPVARAKATGLERRSVRHWRIASTNVS